MSTHVEWLDRQEAEREKERAALQLALEKLTEQHDKLTRLRAENERLRAVLEPFARWAGQMDSPPNWVPDGCPIIASPGDVSDFCVGMLRRARAALGGEEQPNG